MVEVATKTMRKNKDWMWHFVGCIVFMILGFVCWFALYSFIGCEHPYFVIALINFINYIGHGLINLLIRWRKVIRKEISTHGT